MPKTKYFSTYMREVDTEHGSDGSIAQSLSDVRGFTPSEVIDVACKENTDEQASEQLYTATAIAQELGVSDATIRTRWFPYLEEAVDVSRLKNGVSYTSLAMELFRSFANKGSITAAEWVSRTKAEYTPQVTPTVSDVPVVEESALAPWQQNLDAITQRRREAQQRKEMGLARFAMVSADIQASEEISLEEEEDAIYEEEYERELRREAIRMKAREEAKAAARSLLRGKPECKPSPQSA